jgi:hypothetical protein
LLAYLDDTLEPAEIREFGQKVAESDAAQELIARIKQVTRRRRLTTPPATGPGAKFDPNTIAEYLDNLLSADQIAEVEKTCLESDVHLAEIASCHQILTLVLGEPVLVPPTAKQRMYSLVRGREAQPRRKPAAAGVTNGVTNDARHDADETLLLGLPLYHRQATWLRWVLPLGAACLLLILGFFIWRSIDAGSGRRVFAKNKSDKETANSANASNENANKQTNARTDKETTKDDKETKGDDKETKIDDKAPKKDDNPQRPAPPSKEIRELGSYDVRAGALPSVLFQRPHDRDQWLRMRPDSAVSSQDVLLSPPGFSAELHLQSGVHVQLMGNVPEFMSIPPVLESAVVLHPNEKFDADLTFDRGRIVLSNHKDQEAAHCRIRFHSEVWDLSLEEAGTEIGLYLTGTHQDSFESGVSPFSELFLCVLKGKAVAVIGHEAFTLRPPPNQSAFVWNNVGRGTENPLALRQTPPFWTKTLPENSQADEMLRAVKELQAGLTGKTTVESVLLNSLRSERTSHRRLAVRCLGAIDDLPHLLDALGDDDPTHADVRLEAIAVLRRWIGRNAEQDKKLYNKQEGTGALIEKKYKPVQAEIVMQLLHYLSEEERSKPETYEALIDYLMNNKLAIRELAYWHLMRLYPKGLDYNYNPAQGTDERTKAYQKWQQLLKDGKLPPPKPTAPPPVVPGGGP